MNSLYESPFNTRYASRQMLELFSSDTKFRLWRQLWITLAEAEKQLGIAITDKQIDELKKFKDDINYDVAEKKERELKHDVMAHIHAYGEQCPEARGIIHYGATSCYVTDNADIIIMRMGLELIARKLLAVIKALTSFALQYKDLPALGFTHLQPAQLVTVGKRACLWIQDLMMDYEDFEYIHKNMKLLGSKGTTGTQASFLKIFEGDHEKVRQLDNLIAQKMGFSEVFPVSGQTYTRKLDSRIANVLSGIAQSASKFSYDMRLLQSMKELEEPFESSQVGSSAMAYKRNPMRCERITALSRYVIVNSLNPALTASTQWLERSLDDSANRRISISEAFLAVDSILNIYLNVVKGIVVYPAVVAKHVKAELPFIETENILMSSVKRGGDRQELHEKIRKHAMEASRKIKSEGGENDLMQRIVADKSFRLSADSEHTLDPSDFTGRSAGQVEEYIRGHIEPFLQRYLVNTDEYEFKY